MTLARALDDRQPADWRIGHRIVFDPHSAGRRPGVITATCTLFSIAVEYLGVP